MKFKEQKGNVFVFSRGCICRGEYVEEELKLIKCDLEDPEFGVVFQYRHILVSTSGHVNTESLGFARNSDIQTAVNLMQILIKEGLV